MPQSRIEHGRTFEENIDTLHDELVLAMKWGRPSVLVAVNKSRFGQEKAEKALEVRLGQEGLGVKRVLINDKRADISALIDPNEAKAAASVFFISNIDWGGGEDGADAYRGLNLHRELFVDGKIKAVFWLTANEAARLPRLAPDFWAFRHRVVEFIAQRVPTNISLPAGVLLWDGEGPAEIFQEPDESIRAREELLERLPDTTEALAGRVELHYSIGYLHWKAGRLSEALHSFEAGLMMAKEAELAGLRSHVLNGKGIVLYEQGELEGALGAFRQGLESRGSDPSLLINFAATSSRLGRSTEALASSNKAVRMSPRDAECWNRFGYIAAALGRTDEGIQHLTRAAQLAPRAASHHEALATLYSLVDLPDEGRQHLEKARELQGGAPGGYWKALHAMITGGEERAREELRRAVASGELSEHDVRRDPNLNLLLGAEALAILVS
jgi:tetratricopeptide (TPR) repeat protein